MHNLARLSSSAEWHPDQFGGEWVVLFGQNIKFFSFLAEFKRVEGRTIRYRSPCFNNFGYRIVGKYRYFRYIVYRYASLHDTNIKLPPLSMFSGEYKCSEGWKLVEDKCIRVHNKEEEKATWHEASKRCRELNSTLASIRSETQHNILSSKCTCSA